MSALFILQTADDAGGSTLGRMLADIPHDLPAVVGYALIVLFIYFVWKGSRGNGKRSR
jgi:hypothetical protein